MATLAAASPAHAIDAKTLRDLIARELPDVIAIRRDLHAHPEMSYEEHRTCLVVQRELNQAGIDFKAGLAGGTGVMGHIPANGTADVHAQLGHSSSAAQPRAVGLRADLDALPIHETGIVPYRSTIPGKMHACGHDGHTAILIGAARVLKKIAQNNGGLPKPVSFLFQPAEEGGAGAKKLVDEGCLTGAIIGPPIESMFGLHGWPRLPQGVVATRVGPLLAASDRFDITITGIGSHAAFPHVSRDPIVAAAAIVGALQSIASRNLNPLDALVISVTMLNAGTAYNVIPSQAKISGTVRTLTPEVVEMAQRRINEIATGIAKAHGCEASFDYRFGYPVMRNDAGAVEIFNTVAKQTLGADRVLSMPQPVMGGEDFAFYSQIVPSCFFVLGLIPPGQKAVPDLHQPDFNFNDDAIATGIEIFCRLAMRT